MADLKISQLSDGGASQATDEYVVARSGSNFRIDGASVAAAATSVGTLSSLTVSGAITSTLTSGIVFTNTSGGTNATQFRLNNTGGDVRIGVESSAGQAIQVGTSAYAAVFGNQANYPTQFTTNGTTRMTISSTGNVGIGTASPGYALDVVGGSATALRISGNSAVTNNTAMRFYGLNAAADLWAIGNAVSTNDATRNFDIYDLVAGANRFRLDASGNLGLGVTPSAWSGGKAIERGFAGTSDWGFSQASSYRTTNAYFNSGWKYGGTGAACNYAQEAGAHTWSTAASGTAGNAISFTDAMKLDASGNLGVGTTSPATRLDVAQTNAKSATAVWQIQTFDTTSATTGVGGGISFGGYKTSNTAAEVFAAIDGYKENATGGNAAGALRFHTQVSGGTGVVERARITSGGDVQIRTADAYLYSNGTSGGTTIDAGFRFLSSSKVLSFWTNDTERARITSGGYFKASNDATYQGTTGAYHEFRTTQNDQVSLFVTSTAASGNQYGIQVRTANDQNNGTNNFLTCYGASTERATINSNGGLSNYSANNVNLASDFRLKQDIAPLASTWDKLKAIEVVNFRYKDCNEDDPALYGVIAQQVQPIVPELVVVTREAVEAKDAELDEDGNEVKPAVEAAPEYYGIREQPMYWLAIKALQEAQARIEALEARLEALEA